MKRLGIWTAGLLAGGLQACGGSEAAGPNEGSGGGPADMSVGSGGTTDDDDSTVASEAASPDSTAAPSEVPFDDDSPAIIDDDGEVLDDDQPVFDNECEREIVFEAVTLEEPPPFDVVVVADHSGSIAWSRDELTAGLRDLLDDAKGHDVRVFVLTPTQYGASSPEPVDPMTGEDLVMWRDPVTGTAFGNAMTRYTQACWDVDGVAMSCPAYPAPLSGFSLQGWWNFQMPEPVAIISKDMTAAERAEQQRALTDAVLALGTDGSPQEQPVCTLNRYVLQDEEVLPDNVIFIVLSDEDDSSEPDDCLLGHLVEQTPVEVLTYTRGCTGDCEAYSFSLRRPASQRRLTFSCVPVDDMGNPALDQAVPGELGLPSVDFCETAVEECNTGDLAGARYGCPEGFEVMDCEKSCSESADYFTECSLSLPATGDACTESFVSGEEEYENLADYCEWAFGTEGWSDCQSEGLFVSRATSYAGLSAPEPLMPSADTISMVREFQNTAKAKFGETGFVVETILFDPAFACERQEGQSYGETLRELASTPDDVFPICESYAPALSRAERFARALLETEYALELGETERIEAVVVTDREGTERTLDPTSYAHADGQLSIQPDAITSADITLTLEISKICVQGAR